MNDEKMDDTTRRLMEEADPAPEFPGEEIRDRIRSTLTRRRHQEQMPSPSRATPAWLKGAAALAASLLLFIGGVEYGRRAGRPVMDDPPGVAMATERSASRQIPLEIQLSGSRYISSLSRLTEGAGNLSPEEREQARQVALAVLYGAAAELLREAPGDPVAGTIFETVQAQRRRLSEGEEEGKVWF